MIKHADQPDTLLARFGSLADATRLRLLHLLETNELGVVELCDVLQMPQSTISRHLKLLSEQGWVDSRRQGTGNLYRMRLDELDAGAKNLWSLAREQTDDWAAVQQDELRLARRRSEQEGAARFFEGAAKQWDQLRHELYGSSFTQAAVLGLMPANWTVADLGCGTGATTVQLAHHVNRVIAVDNAPAMLKAARKRATAAKREGATAEIDVRRGDLTDLPIEDDTCDAAMIVIVLTYLDDPAVAVREMARVLRTGGRAVIVDLLRHDREDFRREMGQRWAGFATDDLTTMLNDAGFTNVRFRVLPPEAQAKGPALLLAVADAP